MGIIKFRKSKEKWCEEESDSKESEEDQGSGKFCKRKDKNTRKRKITTGKKDKKSLVKMIRSMGVTKK